MFRVSSTPSARKVVNAIRLEIKTELQRVGNILLDEAKKQTPFKQGRARRGWTKQQSGNTVRVINRVPYIENLENNSSRQTRGKGISRPAMARTTNRRKR